MTISVTPEEIHAFQLRLTTWGLERAQAVADWIEQQPVVTAYADFSSSRRFDRAKLVKMLADWDAAHPTPKLIPAV